MGGEPSFELIVACVLGELDPARAEEMHRAAAADPRIAASLGRVRALIETMRADDSAAPPRALVDRARSLLRPAAAAAWWTRAVEVVAGLVFDSRAQLAATGFRGSAMGRQLSYQGEFGEVDLSVTEREGGGWTLLGQVDAAGEMPARGVALLAPGSTEPSATATPDAGGLFRVHTSLAACEVRLLIGDRIIGLGVVSLE